ESILKTIAFKQGKEGSTQKGVDEVQKFWKNKLGIDSDALAILDGSGLSPENRVTTLTMASILQSSLREPWYKYFYESLPLFNDMKMKSGSIRKVLGYTGYHKSSSGTPYVFAFITNNYNGSSSAIKRKMFKVLDELK
ncbi:MAG: D-alanyl-D-alanine carboxypeptidase, partial [Sphingobacteriaceae bacterium]